LRPDNHQQAAINNTKNRLPREKFGS
jgi:hypothetical protein